MSKVKLVKAKNRILLMTHPSAGKTTFWREIGGQDNGSHWGNLGDEWKKKDWHGQSLEERNARRGSAITKQGYYKNCHVIDQPFSGAGDRASQERLVMLGFPLTKKDKKTGEKRNVTMIADMCLNGNVPQKLEKKESICYMGGLFHRKPMPYIENNLIKMVGVIRPDDIIERNCWERSERGKYTIKERRWSDVDRVKKYRDDLQDYCGDWKIPVFTDFKEALDSIL